MTMAPKILQILILRFKTIKRNSMTLKEKAKELVDKFIQHIPLEDAEHGVTEQMFLQWGHAK